MAATVLRLRRSLALSSTLLNHSKLFSSAVPSITPPISSPSTTHQNPSWHDVTRSKHNSHPFQFISSRAMSSRSRYNDDMDGDQISPDAILFEGCDYNHWLITMDFPKDPKPSPEEMVETYVQTAAKVLGSVEEAKKKIYACSTTTYQGFQVEVSEEVSEQFKSIPGVVFVLPDSYIDPVNKEYGGDKYINGTIIPRPPPVQYGRQGGRYNDRNREYNRPPPRGQFEQNNATGGQGNYQRGPPPSNQANYNQGEQRTFPQRDQGNYAQTEQRDFRGQSSNFTLQPGGGYNQGSGGGYNQGGGSGGYNQGGGGGYRQGTGGQYDQGRSGGYRQGTGGQYGGGGSGYGQGAGGQYGQTGGGNYGQGTAGQYGQGGGWSNGQGGGQQGQGGGRSYGQVSGGNFRQGAGGSYGQGMGYGGGNQASTQYGENSNFSQAGQRGSFGGQQGNYEGVNEAEAFKER
ncbi:uncharacterized protein LOC143562995 [Bidens hawaiensis]|uniref:uncharacterized protein LOC143562995 n=1 Tax=Bidens hawaiensis TaxID=980011 RepID=UPI00404B5EA4